jgi:hypothetical protein
MSAATLALDPVDAYLAAGEAYSSGTGSEEDLIAAMEIIDYWEPPTMRDFVRKYAAVYDHDLVPDKDARALMVEQARRLLA